MDNASLNSVLTINKNNSQTKSNMALILVVEVGSNSDGDNLGIAHMIEHMLLSFDRLQMDIGIKNYSVFGKTSFETTTYTLICPDTIDNAKKRTQCTKIDFKWSLFKYML